jgi:hypothetical protein
MVKQVSADQVIRGVIMPRGKREQILSQFANVASLFLAAKDDNVNSTAALLNHFLLVSSLGHNWEKA